MGMPSSHGEEAVAPRVPPVPAKPTPAEQHEHCATGHAACRSRIVSKVEESWSRPRLLGEKGESMTTSDQTMRQFDDGKSKTIAKRDHFFWTCQVGRAAKIGGTVEGLDEALHAQKR